MANNEILRPGSGMNGEEVDVKQKSLFARLKKMMSQGSVVRNVGGKKLVRKDTSDLQYATDRNSLRDRFNRVRSTSYNAYTRDFSLAYQAARIDLFRDYDCVGPDTVIPLPDGTYPTIAELTEKYKDKPQERFYVFSYDHVSKSIKLGKAFHPRKKGKRIGFKVSFDNGQYVVGSIKHPFLMRNGEYKTIFDLKVGESVMPFYQKDFYSDGYRHLYNFSKGWQSEHRIVAEQFNKKIITESECVHHRDFNKQNNHPNNLQVMTKSEHSDKSNEKRSKTLKKVFINRDQTAENNPKYREDLTIEVLRVKATEHYKENGKLTSWGLMKYIGCDYSVLQNRLKNNGYDWNFFKKEIVSTLNHKIVSIECIGELDVYDVTVDKYHNFATDVCFVKNTMDMDPILASALDIYADECVHGDTIIPLLNGEKVKISDLYLQNRKDFWVYSLNENGGFIPAKCEKVALNGKKKMFKVLLDDGTEIKCTSNHQWVKSDGNIITTNELTHGTSLKVLNTKLSSNKFMNGYEMLYQDGKWKNFSPINSINVNDYETDVINGLNALELEKKYNLSRKNRNKLNKQICQKYNIYRIYQLKTINQNSINIPIFDIKIKAIKEIKNGNNVFRNLSIISESYNLTNKQLWWYIRSKGYKGIKDLVDSNNHRVVSIIEDGEYDAYDLVNVGNTTHLYAIETKDGSKLFTHNCLTINEMGKVLVCHAEDDNIKGILTNLFYDVLNIEHNLWSWTRNMCKYGDFYMRLYISPEYGVYQVEPISAYNVERLENTDPLNKNYVKFQIRPTDTSQVETLESFECAHFRLLSDSNFLPYGKAMIEGARRVWKQLSLLEDAMLINRIMRAPERRIFKIDIGNIPPQDVDAFMEKMIQKTKKTPYIDQQTGDYNLRFNLMNMVEDFYLPVRGVDSGTQIDTLSGIEWTGIDDIEYVRNKMMAALKIPKAFLGYEEELSGKATLASEDVRFARTIQRIQRIIISELEKIAIVHLYAQGYRDESLVNFKLELTNPSTIFEKEKIEVWSNKVEVASRMMEIKLFPKSWVYKNVFNLSEDDVEGLQDEVVEDSKQLYRFRSIEEEGNDPAQPFKKINPNVQPGQVPAGGSLPPPPLGGGLNDLGTPGGIGGAPIGGAGAPLMEETDDVGSLVYETPMKPVLLHPTGKKESLLPNQPDPQSSMDNGLAEEQGEHSEEWHRNRPSQAGNKDARADYPFGEDPLGNIENNSKPRPGRALTHKFAKNSPLALEAERKARQAENVKRIETMQRGNVITSLQAFLDKTGTEKKGLIKEADDKSIMDPSILIDE